MFSVARFFFFFAFFSVQTQSIQLELFDFCVQETVRRNRFVGSLIERGSSPEKTVLKMKL